MQQNEPIVIEFLITDIFNKCLLHIKKTTDIITLINHTLRTYDSEQFPPLDVDALPISIDDSEVEKSEISPQEQAYGWIFKRL